jgi:hypothetical protein
VDGSQCLPRSQAGPAELRRSPGTHIPCRINLRRPIMTKILSALAAGLFALTLGFSAHAASDQYKAAKKQADTTYKSAKAECKKMSGDEKKSCMNRAKADHQAAVDRAKTMK